MLFAFLLGFFVVFHVCLVLSEKRLFCGVDERRGHSPQNIRDFTSRICSRALKSWSGLVQSAFCFSLGVFCCLLALRGSSQTFVPRLKRSLVLFCLFLERTLLRSDCGVLIAGVCFSFLDCHVSCSFGAFVAFFLSCLSGHLVWFCVCLFCFQTAFVLAKLSLNACGFGGQEIAVFAFESILHRFIVFVSLGIVVQRVFLLARGSREEKNTSPTQPKKCFKSKVAE